MEDTTCLRLGSSDLEFLARSARSATLAELHDTAVDFAHRFQFERWIYGISGPEAVLASKYPQDWIEGYVRNRLHRGCDPILEAMRARRRAVHWDLRRRQPFGHALDANQKVILSDRWHFGARHGITAPVFDSVRRFSEFAVMSFTRKAQLTEVEQRHHEPRVQLFASYFHSVGAILMLANTASDSAGEDSPALTPREYDCLNWAACGKTNWEIAQLLGLSEPTVVFHLSKVARKFGVRGRIATVAKATRLRAIAPY